MFLSVLVVFATLFAGTLGLILELLVPPTKAQSTPEDAP
jgi:hypothetical protein